MCRDSGRPRAARALCIMSWQLGLVVPEAAFGFQRSLLPLQCATPNVACGVFLRRPRSMCPPLKSSPVRPVVEGIKGNLRGALPSSHWVKVSERNIWRAAQLNLLMSWVSVTYDLKGHWNPFWTGFSVFRVNLVFKSSIVGFMKLNLWQKCAQILSGSLIHWVFYLLRRTYYTGVGRNLSTVYCNKLTRLQSPYNKGSLSIICWGMTMLLCI